MGVDTWLIQMQSVRHMFSTGVFVLESQTTGKVGDTAIYIWLHVPDIVEIMKIKKQAVIWHFLHAQIYCSKLVTLKHHTDVDAVSCHEIASTSVWYFFNNMLWNCVYINLMFFQQYAMTLHEYQYEVNPVWCHFSSMLWHCIDISMMLFKIRHDIGSILVWYCFKIWHCIDTSMMLFHQINISMIFHLCVVIVHQGQYDAISAIVCKIASTSDWHCVHVINSESPEKPSFLGKDLNDVIVSISVS